jgi:L-lactate dehydrogenase complex protein LldG
MPAGQIKNRSSFLDNLAKNLGRERRNTVEKPVWKHNPQWEVLKNFSQDELAGVLIKQCEIIHTEVHRTVTADLPFLITELIKETGGKSVVTWDDPRFEECGLGSMQSILKTDGIDLHVWDPEAGEENLAISATADIGITFSDTTLAESGTVVLFSGQGKGRSVSLLPAIYFAIIPKSTIVPRMTQAAKAIHEMSARGEEVPSCINFISGPSNSADIEMNLIVGVHGPVKAVYLVVDDL